MLQNMRHTVAALAAASAAFAGSALAANDGPCRLGAADLPTDVQAYAEMAGTCLSHPPDGVQLRPDLEARLLKAINARRDRADIDALEGREGLTKAARLHAMDIALRDYIAHKDPEGRSHLDRIRLLDRTGLYGEAGGNIAIVGVDKAGSIDERISADEVNYANLTRPGFTHAGVGVVEAEGRLYAVELFARLDGELSEPLPYKVTRLDNIHPRFADDSFALERVSLESTGGKRLGLSLNPRLVNIEHTGETASLDIAASDGETVYTLRGPTVTAGPED